MRGLAGLVAAVASLFGAQPAFANASANADILAPLRAAQAARHQSGDEEFRSLFANWQSLDQGGARAALVAPAMNGAGARIGGVIPGFATDTVSIPSLVPVEGVRLTSDFGMRWHPVLGGRRAHKGVDLAAPAGTPIRASADGVVERADWFAGYGLYVALEHGGQIETRYGHMSRLNVAAGQRVRKGDVIGYVGSTGRSTGPHLHYEVRIGGEAVNPIPYLQSGTVSTLAAGTTQLALAETDED
ncbi:M23 family metallopeptidase [Novosphingobium piscinae]|uniref:M23 family metallopeptidase n=1 Tax=Novosphingobium piscinae TaxID=1507448 RepID=A0A7X1G0E6_9SPHN|nr:M23 family metallopeptidase [Novosphingobium piscinae]